MAPYEIAQYLLDRANIHDTIYKVPIYYDTRNLAGVLSEIYAPTVEIDYTTILGGQPAKKTREEWVDQIGTLLGAYESTQHTASSIVINNLPQPSGTATRPDTVAVLAEVSANMVPPGGGHDVKTQNGAILEAELRRDPELEQQGQNPWRITKYKVVRKWGRGDEELRQTYRDEK